MATSEESCDGNPDFAVICSFITKFGDDCGVNITIPDLQQMLEDTKNVHEVLSEIHIHLLRRGRKRVTKERWEKSLIKFCHEYSSVDAWELERFGYKKAKLSVKLELLKRLLELQFDANPKFKTEVNKHDATALRIPPVGRDIDGQSYWYQLDKEYNMRLYRQGVEDENVWQLLCSTTDHLKDLLASLEKFNTKHVSAEKSLIDKSEAELKMETGDDLKAHISEDKPCSIIIKTEKKDPSTITNVPSSEEAVKKDSIDDQGSESKAKKEKIEDAKEPKVKSEERLVEYMDTSEVVIKKEVCSVSDDITPVQIDDSKPTKLDESQSKNDSSKCDVEMIDVEGPKSNDSKQLVEKEHLEGKISETNKTKSKDIGKCAQVSEVQVPETECKGSKIKLYEKWSNEKKQAASATVQSTDSSKPISCGSITNQKGQTSPNKFQPANLVVESQKSPESALNKSKLSSSLVENTPSRDDAPMDLSVSFRSSDPLVKNAAEPSPTDLSAPSKKRTHPDSEKTSRSYNGGNERQSPFLPHDSRKICGSIPSEAPRPFKKKHLSMAMEESNMDSRKSVIFEVKNNKLFNQYQENKHGGDSVIKDQSLASSSGFSHLQALQNMCNDNPMTCFQSSVIHPAGQGLAGKGPNSDGGLGKFDSQKKSSYNEAACDSLSKKYKFNYAQLSGDVKLASESVTASPLLKSNISSSKEASKDDSIPKTHSIASLVATKKDVESSNKDLGSVCNMSKTMSKHSEPIARLGVDLAPKTQNSAKSSRESNVKSDTGNYSAIEKHSKALEPGIVLSDKPLSTSVHTKQELQEPSKHCDNGSKETKVVEKADPKVSRKSSEKGNHSIEKIIDKTSVCSASKPIEMHQKVSDTTNSSEMTFGQSPCLASDKSKISPDSGVTASITESGNEQSIKKDPSNIIKDSTNELNKDMDDNIQKSCKGPVKDTGDNIQKACKEPVEDTGDKIQNICKEPVKDAGDNIQKACKEPVKDTGDKVQNICKEPVKDPDDSIQKTCKEPVKDKDDSIQKTCKEPVKDKDDSIQKTCKKPVKDKDDSIQKVCKEPLEDKDDSIQKASCKEPVKDKDDSIQKACKELVKDKDSIQKTCEEPVPADEAKKESGNSDQSILLEKDLHNTELMTTDFVGKSIELSQATDNLKKNCGVVKDNEQEQNSSNMAHSISVKTVPTDLKDAPKADSKESKDQKTSVPDSSKSISTSETSEVETDKGKSIEKSNNSVKETVSKPVSDIPPEQNKSDVPIVNSELIKCDSICKTPSVESTVPYKEPEVADVKIKEGSADPLTTTITSSGKQKDSTTSEKIVDSQKAESLESSLEESAEPDEKTCTSKKDDIVKSQPSEKLLADASIDSKDSVKTQSKDLESEAVELANSGESAVISKIDPIESGDKLKDFKSAEGSVTEIDKTDGKETIKSKCEGKLDEVDKTQVSDSITSANSSKLDLGDKIKEDVNKQAQTPSKSSVNCQQGEKDDILTKDTAKATDVKEVIASIHQDKSTVVSDFDKKVNEPSNISEDVSLIHTSELDSESNKLVIEDKSEKVPSNSSCKQTSEPSCENKNELIKEVSEKISSNSSDKLITQSPKLGSDSTKQSEAASVETARECDKKSPESTCDVINDSKEEKVEMEVLSGKETTKEVLKSTETLKSAFGKNISSPEKKGDALKKDGSLETDDKMEVETGEKHEIDAKGKGDEVLSKTDETSLNLSSKQSSKIKIDDKDSSKLKNKSKDDKKVLKESDKDMANGMRKSKEIPDDIADKIASEKTKSSKVTADPKDNSDEIASEKSKSSKATADPKDNSDEIASEKIKSKATEDPKDNSNEVTSEKTKSPKATADSKDNSNEVTSEKTKLPKATADPKDNSDETANEKTESSQADPKDNSQNCEKSIPESVQNKKKQKPAKVNRNQRNRSRSQVLGTKVENESKTCQETPNDVSSIKKAKNNKKVSKTPDEDKELETSKIKDGVESEKSEADDAKPKKDTEDSILTVPESKEIKSSSSSELNESSKSVGDAKAKCDISFDVVSKLNLKDPLSVYFVMRNRCRETKFMHLHREKPSAPKPPSKVTPKQSLITSFSMDVTDDMEMIHAEVSASPVKKKRGRLRPKGPDPKPVQSSVPPKAAPTRTPAAKTPAKTANSRRQRGAARAKAPAAAEKDSFTLPEGFLEILSNSQSEGRSAKKEPQRKPRGRKLNISAPSLHSSESESAPIKRSSRIQAQHEKKMSELAVEMEREQRMLEMLAKKTVKKGTPTKTPTPVKAKETKAPKAGKSKFEPPTPEDTCLETKRTTRKMNSRSRNMTKMTLMYEDESKDSEFSTSRETEKSKKRRRGRGSGKKGYKPWDLSSESESSLEELTEEEEEEEEPEEILIFDVNEDEFACEEIEENAEPVIVRRARTAKKASEDQTAEETVVNDDKPCCNCGKFDKPEWILLCDKCDNGYHTHCLKPPLSLIPDGDWYCQPCEHMFLCEWLQKEVHDLELVIKQREREELRKQRLAYVGISLDNVLKPDKKEKSDESSKEEESEAESKGEKSRESSEDERHKKLYGKRSVRARRNVNYQFKEYDALIASAIQEEFLDEKLTEDEEKFSDDEKQKETDKPFKAKLPKRKRKKPRMNDLDFSEDDIDSGEEYKGSSSDSEQTAPPSSNESDGESAASGEWRIVKTKGKGKKGKKQKRGRRGGSSDEEWDENDSDTYRPVTRRAAQKVSYRELSSDDEWGEQPKAKVSRKRKKQSSSEDSEASYKKKKPKRKSRVRKWASSDSSEESERSVSYNSNSSQQSEDEWKVKKSSEGRIKININKKVLSSEEEENESSEEPPPKKPPPKVVSEEEESEEEEGDEEEEEESSEEEEEEDDDEEEEESEEESKPAPKLVEKPAVREKEPVKAEPPKMVETPKPVMKTEVKPSVVPPEPPKSIAAPVPVRDKAPAPIRTVKKDATKMVPCVIPYDKSPKSGHGTNPDEESDKDIVKESVPKATKVLPFTKTMPQAAPRPHGIPASVTRPPVNLASIDRRPFKSTIIQPFSNIEDDGESDDEVPLERIPTSVPTPAPSKAMGFERDTEYTPAKELAGFSYTAPEEKCFPPTYSPLAPFQDYSSRPSPLKPSLVETYSNNSSPSKLTPLDSYSQTNSPKGFISLDSYSDSRKKKQHFYGNPASETEGLPRSSVTDNYPGGEIRFPPEPYPCSSSPGNYPQRSPSHVPRDPGTPPRLYSQYPDNYAPPRSPDYYQNHQYFPPEERVPRPAYQPNYVPPESIPPFVTNPYVATPVPQPNGGFMIDTLLRARNPENEEDELTEVTDIVSYITQE